MKKHILLSLAAIILSFTSCVKPEEGGKDNPPTPQEQIVIPSTVDVKPVVSPEGGDTRITFTAASAWTASVISTKADSWVDVNPKSGNPGAAEIKITTAKNDTYVERNATIQIKCGTQTKEVVLTQKQLDNITVTTDKVELGVEGGSFTIELKTNVDFSYEIEGGWIKYVSTKAYTDRTLTFTAEANESVQKREGSVTVKGGGFSETVKVYQSGEKPTLIITQNEYNLEAEGGSITVEVSSNVAVTMTIPESAGWITENSTKSVSTSTFHLDVAANETNESRSTEITFSNEESGLSEKVTVNQEGKIYVPVTDMVDLGLSVKWATCNIGASKPEEYGGYYQWAGLEDVTSTDISIGFDENQGIHNCPYHKEGSDYSTGWTKYVQSEISWSGTGSPDHKSVLESEDDIAHVTLGDKWRMPTDAEWTELRENCTWTWTGDYNGTGVAGRIVTSNMPGYTDKSIFLPAAGYRDEVSLLSDGLNCSYWSSSRETNRSYLAYWVNSSSSYIKRQNCYRFYGYSVRPVYGDKVSVTGISINSAGISLNVGETSSLRATVVPSNAAEKSVSWTSSDTGVATVDQSGNVTAVKAGNATITVKTTDGGYTASCSVTVKSSDPAVPEMVDLGLSVKWASFNVGASKPEEYGGYYQWAGIDDVTDRSIYVDWNNCPYHTGSSSSTGWTKYVSSSKSSYWSGTGSPDNKTVLDPEDDVAHVKLGGKWRMPTRAEFDELINNCQCDWVTYKGVKGRKFTSKKAGYTDKWIFLPAAGFRYGYVYDAGSYGYYWSSSLDTGYPDRACHMDFTSDDVGTYGDYRYSGQSVRPVYDHKGDDKVRVTGVSLEPTSISLNVGEKYTLCATVTPSNATDKTVNWASDKAEVATVDDQGNVHAVTAGTANITVTTTDGGKTATCAVKVKAALPAGALPGVFTVSNDDGTTKTQIYFSQGNLWYDGSKFNFEANQYSATSYANNHVSHFYWSKDASVAYAEGYNDGSASGSDVFFTNETETTSKDGFTVNVGGTEQTGWRTLSTAEWTYLFNNHTKKWATVNGVNGYVIAPDGFEGTLADSYADDAALAAADNLVFLPVAGSRNGSIVILVGFGGLYWSSSADGSDSAYGVYFSSSLVYPDFYDPRNHGFSVRLITESK